MLRRTKRLVDAFIALTRGKNTFDGIDVWGKPGFRSVVGQALSLLKAQEVATWQVLRDHVDYVFEATWSSTTSTYPASIYMGRRETSAGAIVVAAALAYYACQITILKRWLPPERHVRANELLSPEATERCNKAYHDCFESLVARADQEGLSTTVLLN